MHIMNNLMSQPILAFLGSVFQAKVTKFGINVGLNMLINKSSRFYGFLANVFHIFQLRTLKTTVSALTPIIFLRSFSNVERTFIAIRSWMSSIMEVLPC